MALLDWAWPSAWQWAGFLLSGALGTAGHYFLTKSFSKADISSTQSLKFLELVWSALMGWLLFSDVPTVNAIIGGVVISAATIWVARRESLSDSTAEKNYSKEQLKSHEQDNINKVS
jgi:drug/metabolite transporter (DMT)-like permease